MEHSFLYQWGSVTVYTASMILSTVQTDSGDQTASFRHAADILWVPLLHWENALLLGI